MITKEERSFQFLSLFMAAKEKTKEDIDTFKHLFFRLMDNLGFFPTDLRRVTIEVRPGSTTTRYPEIQVPHRKNINLTLFIEQLFTLIEMANEKNPLQTMSFIEYFCKIVWKNELLDINPLFGTYVDYIDPQEVIEALNSNTYNFQKIYDWKTDFKHIFSKEELLEYL